MGKQIEPKRFMSRKFLTAIGASIIAFVGSMFPGQEDVAERIVMIAISYIAAQGVVDSVTEYKGVKDEHQ